MRKLSGNKTMLLVVISLILLSMFVVLQKKNSTYTLDSDAKQRLSGTPGTQAQQTTIQKVPTVSQINLTISQPSDGQTVTTPNIVVSGKTVANAEVAVNDVTLKADTKGDFSTSLLLDPGENIISVVANDVNGNFSEKEIIVTFQTSDLVQ